MEKMKKLASFLLVLAMVMAMVPAVLAAEKAVDSVTISQETAELKVGETVTLTAEPQYAEGEGDNVNVAWSSSKESVATVLNGVVTAVAEGSATITATAGGKTATCEVTVTKATATVGTPDALFFAVGKGTETEIKAAIIAKVSPEAARQYATVALKDGTDAFDPSKKNTQTLTYVVSIPEDNAYYSLASTEVSVNVTVKDAPVINKVEVTADSDKFIFEDISGTSVVSLTAAATLPEGSSAKSYHYEWYKEAQKVGSDSSTYDVPKDDFKNSESVSYTCAVTPVDENGIEGKPVTGRIKIEVKKKYTATVTLSNTTVKPQNSITLPVPTVKANKVEGNEFKWTVLSANNFTYTYSISSTAFAAVSGNVFTAKNVGTNTGTPSQKVTVTLNVKSKDTTPVDLCTATADITITAPKTEDIAIFENTEFSDWEIAYAVSTALHGANGYYGYYDETQKVSFSATNGKLYNNRFTSGVTSITSAIPDSWVTTTGKNTVNSTYFIRNRNATNAYVKFYALDKDGGIIAYGEMKSAENKTVNYSVSSSENVVFDEDDFLKFFREATGSTSATLGYVRFSPEMYSIRNISGTGKYGALYDGTGYAASYVKSTDTFYYNATALQDDLDAVTYYADSTSAKYVVYIPFTATGKVGLSDRTVTGMVAISVNNDSAITMLGTTFKAAGIKNEILAENSTISSAIAYVTFSAPADAGKLYYDYSSIVTGANTPVSALDKFYFSGTGSTKLVDNVYFVPAAGCKDTVSIAYTLYNTSNKSLATGTISFRVTKKTASGIFNDITASNTGSWSADAIDFLATNGVIKGTDSRTFTATANMKRCDFVVMMYRLAGEPSVRNYSNPFTDVKATDYYYNAVLWAYAKNVVTGNSKTTFNPQGNITREQIAAILYRYSGSRGAAYSYALSGYYDANKVSSYALEAMRWAVSNGIISGSGYYLNPTNNATRAEVAAMLHRFVTR